MYSEYSNKIKPISVKILSILVGFFLCMDFISMYLFPTEDGTVASGGMLGLMYLGCIGLVVCVSIFSGFFSVRHMPKSILLIECFLIAFYIFSNSTLPESHTPTNIFVLFTLIAFFLPSVVEVDVRIMLKSIMLLSAPGIIRINAIVAPLVFNSDRLSMGFSYALLIPSLVSIVYIIFYFKDESVFQKALTIILSAISLVFLFFLVSLGSRGPVLTIILLLLFIYVFKYNQSQGGILLNKKKGILLFLIIIIGYALFVPILEYLQSLLASYDISIAFIDRTIKQSINGEGIDSGRDILYVLAYDGIMSRPIFGHGFDQFENNTGWVYPHNFIMQLLYDGGLLLFSVLIIPVIRSIVTWFKQCCFEQYVLIVVLFFLSVPGALFSHDLWAIGPLWFFMGATLMNNKLN